MEGRLEHADAAYIRDRIGATWGFPIISTTGAYNGPDELKGLVWRDESEQILGLVTWFVKGNWAEIVTLDAYEQGRHIGGRLLDAAEAELLEYGVRWVSITTTNDNIRAIAFYLRRGYRIVKVELEGMERVRAVKPSVPLEGHEGLPLRDMLEFERAIG